MYDKDRDPIELEPHYHQHVFAMTSEKLHSKSDIAMELAWRDQQIERLTMQRDEARKLASEWSNEAGAEIARLRAIIEAAPHDSQCSTWTPIDTPNRVCGCDCWKKGAT